MKQFRPFVHFTLLCVQELLHSYVQMTAES